jgi:hypothetical protein
MRGRLVTIAAWLVIIACAVIVAARVHSHYSRPDYQAPAVWTPPPLVPNASPAASASATAPHTSATRPRPTHTITVWTTVTAGGGGG